MPTRNNTTLYFIRHGETPSNAHHVHQGIKIDDYLDTEGILQTHRLIPLIPWLNLDVIFTSYLHRAEETAAILKQSLKNPIDVFHDYRLRERDFGSLVGMSNEDWLKLVPNYRELEQFQKYNYRPFGGENVDDVRQRTLTAILDITENHYGQNIGVVTHDGIIRLMLFHFPDIPRIYRDHEAGKQVANADIYEWEITDGQLQNIRSLLK